MYTYLLHTFMLNIYCTVNLSHVYLFNFSLFINLCYYFVNKIPRYIIFFHDYCEKLADLY